MDINRCQASQSWTQKTSLRIHRSIKSNLLPLMTIMPAKMAKCLFKDITKKAEAEWRRKKKISPFCLSPSASQLRLRPRSRSRSQSRTSNPKLAGVEVGGEAPTPESESESVSGVGTPESNFILK